MLLFQDVDYVKQSIVNFPASIIYNTQEHIADLLRIVCSNYLLGVRQPAQTSVQRVPRRVPVSATAVGARRDTSTIPFMDAHVSHVLLRGDSGTIRPKTHRFVTSKLNDNITKVVYVICTNAHVMKICLHILVIYGHSLVK